MVRYWELDNYTEMPTALAFCSFTIDEHVLAEGGEVLLLTQYSPQDKARYRRPADQQKGNEVWFWCALQ